MKCSASLPVLVPLAFILSLAHSRLYALTYLFFMIKYMYKPIYWCDLINRLEMMHFTNVGHSALMNMAESSSLGRVPV